MWQYEQNNKQTNKQAINKNKTTANNKNPSYLSDYESFASRITNQQVKLT